MPEKECHATQAQNDSTVQSPRMAAAPTTALDNHIISSSLCNVVSLARMEELTQTFKKCSLVTNTSKRDFARKVSVREPPMLPSSVRDAPKAFVVDHIKKQLPMLVHETVNIDHLWRIIILQGVEGEEREACLRDKLNQEAFWHSFRVTDGDDD